MIHISNSINHIHKQISAIILVSVLVLLNTISLNAAKYPKKLSKKEAQMEKTRKDLEKAKKSLSDEKKAWKKKELKNEAQKADAIEKEIKKTRKALRKAIDELEAKEKLQKKRNKKEKEKSISKTKENLRKARINYENAKKIFEAEVKTRNNQKKKLKRAKKKAIKAKRLAEKIRRKKEEIARARAIKRKGKKKVKAEEKAKKELEKLRKEQRKLKEREARVKAKEDEQIRKIKERTKKKFRKLREKKEKKARKKREKRERKAKKRARREEKRRRSKAFQKKMDRLGKKVDKMREKMPPELLEERKIKVEPQVKADLLSGAFDIIVKHRVRRSYFEMGAHYDFVDSYMGFDLNYNYKIGRFYTGLFLKDSIDFNEIYSNSEYLQRVQLVEPYTKTKLHKNVDMRLSLGFENTNTTSLDTAEILDRGNNVIGKLRFGHAIFRKRKRKRRFEEDKLPSGLRHSLSFANSMGNLGSDYTYALGEYKFLGVLQFLGENYIEYKFEAGTPLNSDNRPLSSYYWAGGYKTMRGYDYKEFLGESIEYHRFSLNIPLTRLRYNKSLGLEYFIFTFNTAFEAAELGDREIFDNQESIRLSAEAGLEYRVIAFHNLPLKFQLVAAKPLEVRDPKYYLLMSSRFYSWSNE